MPKKQLKQNKSIELRKIINPEDAFYDFIIKVKDHIGSESKSVILDFILSRVSGMDFSEFIQLNQVIP